MDPSSEILAWTPSVKHKPTRNSLTWTLLDKTLSVPRINPQCAVATIGEETVIAVVGGFNDEGKNGARQILNSTEFYTVSNDGFMASKYILF